MGQKKEELDILPPGQEEELDILPPSGTKPIAAPSQLVTAQPQEELQIEPRSTFSQIWHAGNEPLTDLPSRVARGITGMMPDEAKIGADISKVSPFLGSQIAQWGGALRGITEGIGDKMTELSSPINAAAALLSGGESLAAKGGMNLVSKGLNLAGNLPMMAGGAQDISEGNYLTGGLEVGAGVLGLKNPAMAKATLTSVAKPPLPQTVRIKAPSQSLLNKLRGNGYRFSHVGDDGFPVWKLVQDATEVPGKKTSMLKQVWNLPRGASTTADLSAPLRQGLGLIHKKEFWKNIGPMFKAYGKQEAYDNIMGEIHQRPLFQEKAMDKFDDAGKYLGTKTQKSFADEAGLALTDTITKREENIIGDLPEKIPVIGRAAKASNRAYTAYLNKLRADTFENMIKSAGAENDLPQAKIIAEFINTATGRGSLGKLEKNAELLTNTMFSPRLVASRMKYLNPGTYIMQKNAGMRKEYLKSALAMAGSWGTVAGLASAAGADVSFDPTNADFGKVKIGNTRLDPGGGFLQYLVAMARLAKGETTSSTSGKTRELGQEYGTTTRGDTVREFAANKAHPFIKFAHDLFYATKYKNVHMGDRVLQLFVPLIVQDMTDIIKDDPSLLPMAIPAMFGMGTQTYDKGDKEGLFIPKDNDLVFTGGHIF